MGVTRTPEPDPCVCAYRVTMHWLVIGIGVIVVLGLAALSVHLLLTWAARRGWVYYRSPDRRLPPTLGLIEEIYQPSMEHVIDEQVSEQTRADRSESGDSPDPGFDA